MRVTDDMIDSLVCPPPPSEPPAMSDEMINELIVPAPWNGTQSMYIFVIVHYLWSVAQRFGSARSLHVYKCWWVYLGCCQVLRKKLCSEPKRSLCKLWAFSNIWKGKVLSTFMLFPMLLSSPLRREKSERKQWKIICQNFWTFSVHNNELNKWQKLL